LTTGATFGLDADAEDEDATEEEDEDEPPPQPAITAAAQAMRGATLATLDRDKSDSFAYLNRGLGDRRKQAS
jgi:hypothetical protein